METGDYQALAAFKPAGLYRVGEERAHRVSKRGRVGEGRPTKRTPEVVAKIAEAVAIGLTDEEASLLAGINPDTMTEWRKDPEFSGAIKRAGAQRLLMRLERIEAGEQGWQGTAWALERLYPARFARPEVMNQIAVVNQGGKVSTERVIVLPDADFDALIGRPGYHLCENGDLERREGSLVYVMVRQAEHFQWENSLWGMRIALQMSISRQRISGFLERPTCARERSQNHLSNTCRI